MDRDSVYAGKKEDRMMMTRLHNVVDIYFVKCGSYVGWRYAKRNMCMSEHIPKLFGSFCI